MDEYRDTGAGISGDPGDSPESEIARLRAEVAFLQKKLQIVGSITRHDVLNQLTAIVGYNELLGMMVEDPKLKSFLEKERQAVDKIRRQFQAAKEFQNIGLEPPRWIAVRNAVHRVREEAETGTLQIVAETGDMAILADPLFERALARLFENTVRHAGTATGITVSFSEDGTCARLVIADDGIGIPAAEKEKIFERGFGKGGGWGLFLVREILAVTGITVTEEGEPGRGACFVLSLPPGKYRQGGGQ